jgi:hypothetical protein
MVTSSSGVLRSLNNDGNYNGCTWLISVEKDSTIWLTFTEFFIEGSYYSVKVHFISLLIVSQMNKNVFFFFCFSRFMMGLTPQVLCCWTVTAVNRPKLYDQEVTSFLFNCPHNITGDRSMENNSRRIISLYIWLNTVLNFFSKS